MDQPDARIRGSRSVSAAPGDCRTATMPDAEFERALDNPVSRCITSGHTQLAAVYGFTVSTVTLPLKSAVPS